MTKKALTQFTLLITLIAISAGAANAQARRKVTLEASVPFEFIVGNRVFPAGTYTFEMATGLPKASEQAGVLIVRNHERNLYTAVSTGIIADGNAHVAPKLVFLRNGDHVFLSKVWRQGNLAGLSVPNVSGGEMQDWQESQVLTLDAVAIGTI